MECIVVEMYRGYEIYEIVTCGETQGFYGEPIIPATRFFTPAATTLEETKRIIDKSWEIRNGYKKLEYKQKGKRR